MLCFLSCLLPVVDDVKNRDLLIPVLDGSEVASYNEEDAKDSPLATIVALPKSPRSPKSTLEVIFEDEVLLLDVDSPTKQPIRSFYEVVATAAKNPLPTAVVTPPKSPRSPRSTIPTLEVILEDEVKLFPSHLLVPDLESKPCGDLTEASPRPLPTSSSKEAVTDPRSVNKKVLPKSQAGGVFGFRPDPSTAKHSSGARILVVNKDAALEKLAESGDIDGLWTAHDLRCSDSGEMSPDALQALLYIGTYEVSQHNYLGAVKLLREAGRVTDGDHWRVEAGFIKAESLRRIGLVAWEMGDVSSAEEYIRSSLYMHQTNEMNHGRDPNASSDVAQCLHSLGMVRVGDVKSALYTLQRAVAICEQSDPLQLSSVLDSMGSIYFHASDLEMAMVYHKDAYKIKVKAVGRQRISLVSNYKSLGRVYMAIGNYNSATSCYTRAEALLTKKHRQYCDNKTLATGLAGQLEEMQELVASAVSQRDGARVGFTLYV